VGEGGLAPHRGIGRDQPAQVLPRFDGADEEDEQLGQLVSGPHAFELFQVTHGPETGLHAGMHHRDLAGVDPKELDEVVQRVLRVGQHPMGRGDGTRHRGLEMGPQSPIRALRQPDEREVMDRDDPARRHAGRQREVRRVEDVGRPCQAFYAEGHRQLVPPDVEEAFRHAAAAHREVRRKPAELRRRARAEERVLVLMIGFGKR